MLFWLFRLPAMAYFILAPLILVGAGALYITDQRHEAAKAVARTAKPPALVKIEDFKPGRDTGAAQEVNIVGQVDVQTMTEVTRSKRGDVKDRWLIAGIHPTNATDPNAPAIAVMFQHGEATDAQLYAMKVADGPFGPILKLDGTAVDASGESEALGQVSNRIRIAPNALYIDPFEAGRAEGLAPSSSGRDASIFFAVFALLVAGYGFIRRFQGSDGYIKRDDGYI